MKSVLVTGAAGGIGTAVVGALADAGLRVVGVDRRSFVDDRLERTFVGDLREPAFVGECFTDPVDAVVHLAAIPAPGQVPEDETYAQNTMGAYQVLDAAGRAGVQRIVVASSFAALGIAWADRDLSPFYVPVDEKHPTLAVDSYGLSKVATEEIAGFTSRRWGIPIASMRFPFVGTGDRLRTRVEEVRRDPAGNRRELWAWLDTRDAAGAVLAALTADFAGHQVFNIAAPTSLGDIPIVDLVREHHPTTQIRGVIATHGSVVDTSKARALLDFEVVHDWP